MPPLAIKEAANMLLQGYPASQVISTMRLTYKTPESMKSNMSLVKKEILKGDHYSPEYDDTPLRAFKDNPEIASFLDSTLEEKCKIQKRHEYDPTWPEEAEEHLRNLQILPSNLDDFVMSKREMVGIKRRAATKLREKNANVIVVEGGEKLLSELVAILETSTVFSNISAAEVNTLSGSPANGW